MSKQEEIQVKQVFSTTIFTSSRRLVYRLLQPPEWPSRTPHRNHTSQKNNTALTHRKFCFWLAVSWGCVHWVRQLLCEKQQSASYGQKCTIKKVWFTFTVDPADLRQQNFDLILLQDNLRSSYSKWARGMLNRVGHETVGLLSENYWTYFQTFCWSQTTSHFSYLLCEKGKDQKTKLQSVNSFNTILKYVKHQCRSFENVCAFLFWQFWCVLHRMLLYLRGSFESLSHLMLLCEYFKCTMNASDHLEEHTQFTGVGSFQGMQELVYRYDSDLDDLKHVCMKQIWVCPEQCWFLKNRFEDSFCWSEEFYSLTRWFTSWFQNMRTITAKSVDRMENCWLWNCSVGMLQWKVYSSADCHSGQNHCTAWHKVTTNKIPQLTDGIRQTQTTSKNTSQSKQNIRPFWHKQNHDLRTTFTSLYSASRSLNRILCRCLLLVFLFLTSLILPD